MNKNLGNFYPTVQNREIKSRIFVFGNLSMFDYSVLLKNIPRTALFFFKLA